MFPFKALRQIYQPSLELVNWTYQVRMFREQRLVAEAAARASALGFERFETLQTKTWFTFSSDYYRLPSDPAVQLVVTDSFYGFETYFEGGSLLFTTSHRTPTSGSHAHLKVVAGSGLGMKADLEAHLRELRKLRAGGARAHALTDLAALKAMHEEHYLVLPWSRFASAFVYPQGWGFWFPVFLGLSLTLVLGFAAAGLPPLAMVYGVLGLGKVLLALAQLLLVVSTPERLARRVEEEGLESGKELAKRDTREALAAWSGMPLAESAPLGEAPRRAA